MRCATPHEHINPFFFISIFFFFLLLLLDVDGRELTGLGVLEDSGDHVGKEDEVGDNSGGNACIGGVSSKVGINGQEVGSDGEGDHCDGEESELGQGAWSHV